MPLMLLAGGGMNHLLVFMTRYIFEKEEYALNSSRYTLQFQVGIFGIILTFALAMQMKEVVKRLYGMLAALFCVAFLWEMYILPIMRWTRQSTGRNALSRLRPGPWRCPA